MPASICSIAVTPLAITLFHYTKALPVLTALRIVLHVSLQYLGLVIVAITISDVSRETLISFAAAH
ncbi:hypothetical protein RXV91_13485 [Lactiplantibacillus sp. DA1]|uniref:hypothetical protein n=1 Tax=Lactiplantibacillus sp. DA1 TaxID=3079857 RepID=UPI00292A6429|nr:hypothetical protein [Lactiplantibacillus sp. DA1]MDV0431881.1 hypothetical protein [Lactiplantibacillus sp. DA1]